MAGIKIRDVSEETPNVSLSHCEGQRVGTDMGMDPKKLKRVAASREYSQRYRLKQQQYIAHLESGVRALQTQVAITYPKIKYVDTQKSLLRAENCSMKEKLSALSAQLMIKEAEYHELRKEKEMLKQFSLLYQSPIADMSQAKHQCFSRLVNITRGQHQPGLNLFAGEAREQTMPDRNLENQFGCQQRKS